MDCLCCADGGVGPTSDSEFLGSLCRLHNNNKHNNGESSRIPAKFPAEPNRYSLYVVAGCPFAARPWTCLGFYGLSGSGSSVSSSSSSSDKNKPMIRVIKCFPASYDAGWFLEPRSAGEHQLVQSFPDGQVDACPYNSHHLSQLYYKANSDFKGAISVPLLWDSVQDTAVSNSSLGLAEMICTQLRPMATRNIHVDLFPNRLTEPDLYQEHDALVKMLHTRVTTAVYKMNATQCGKTHDTLVDAYYATLDELQDRLQTAGPYLMGSQVRFADIVLFISLVRLDLAYQWRFGLGRKNVRENYPILLAYKKRILALDGIAETVLPRDIMALYFMTLKWVEQDKGRTLPQVPETWEKECCIGTTE